jgi:uncharacterized spore protein YtfJ
MDAKEILEQARDTFTMRRVFGEPIERDGLTVVPVATVMGGAGAGSGEGRPAGGSAQGSGSGLGGGWGGVARPVGVYVIDHGQVRWEPAIDVGRVILGAQVVLVVGLLVLRSVLKRRRRN